MHKIKFRGKTRGGKTFYGDLIHRFAMTAIDEYGNFQEVEPKTVALLVGYDKNGKEIFSDDKIRVYSPQSPHITDHIAGDYFRISDIGKKFDNAELIRRIKP